ncbi:cardiolipin synthase [Sphingomonas sp. BAUL-RG-20F-R05-02]|uniref:cardiolipin synthase n=1 Tax=Sphingomonas sp. BAUL-RG-20F-R05-02 TaxID=2914830 RepID=UPI001F584920|nr:cardiolipin synthase [Sphingomonas sp. BAUL-RG-20F-R05-02]
MLVLGIHADVWLGLFATSQWVIRAGALLVVPFRRSPEAAKGWLLLFMVAPWPATLVYAVIGRARHPKWRRERVAKLPTVVWEALIDAREALAATVAEPPAQLAPIAALGHAIGRMPVLGANQIELEPVYEEVIAKLAADIDGARDHVHLMFYIFADDHTGDAILSALERAVVRGVTCRLMIDAFGSGASRRAIAKRLAGSGIDLRIILPVRFWGKVSRADMRNHRKIAVIDGRTGWMGSQNIVDAGGEAGTPNRELMVRVTGPIVAELQIVFIGDWFLETETALRDDSLFPSPSTEGGSTAQAVASGPDYPCARIDMLFVALIEAARQRVVLTTPYFIPSEPLLFALRSAGLRGIDVTLIVSAASDSRFIDLAQSSYFEELLEAGITIALCETNFLHAKHVSVDDDIAVIGSSNMDMRSFELNSETTLICYDRAVVEQLRRLEQGYRTGGRVLDRESWGTRGLTNKIAGNLARLVSPLL